MNAREDDPDMLAASEAATVPTTAAERADRIEKYDQMLRLADLFDAAGTDLRRRARLGTEVLRDPDVHDTAELSRSTWSQAETDIQRTTTGSQGLLTRGIELDADALMVRSTVLTYRWIDELQQAAFKTLGTIAGRAIGYLAPGVALGGAVVSAGLIETDALDRDGMAAYLNELAEKNPELMDHVTSGGGGLLDGLQMRSLLTAGVLAGENGPLAAAGGLRAVGTDQFPVELGSALRDVAGGFVVETARAAAAAAAAHASAAPDNLEALMLSLAEMRDSLRVDRVGEGRYIAYLHGPADPGQGGPRLVGGDYAAYVAHVVEAIDAAIEEESGARVMLVGSGQGGVTAAEVVSTPITATFVVDHVVTAGAPSAQVPRIPASIRMLSLEDRADPVALLGSLVNAGAENRLTVVFDGATGGYVVGGRAADEATHPEIVAELKRLRAAGYLAG